MKQSIEDFSYENQPYMKMKKFGIIKLSDEGFKEYCDKESYIHLFLKNKHIEKVTEVLERNEKNKEIAFRKATEDKDKNLYENIITHKIIGNDKNFYKPLKTENEYNPIQTECSAFKETMPFLNTTNHRIKQKKSLPQLNTISQSKSHNNKTTKIFFNKDSRYKSDYLTTFESLEASVKDTHENLSKPKPKPPKFFKSYEVPRVDNSLKKTSQPFSFKNVKLLRSVGDYDQITKENEKLKSILLDQGILPSIKEMFNHKTLNEIKYPVRTTFMGQKYNPNNYDYHALKSQTKRNVNGSLYNH